MTQKSSKYPTAFCGLQSVSSSGLEVTDSVNVMTVPWDAVKQITVSMGRQQFDMTPTLMVDHEAGRSIFMFEGERMWTPFLDAVAVHLHQALPAADWSKQLSADPDAVIRVYQRPGEMV